MTTTPISRPDQLGRDRLGGALGAAAVVVALALIAAAPTLTTDRAPTGPVRLDDAGVVAPASTRSGDQEVPAPVIEDPATDWHEIPLFSADDPAAPPIDKTSDRVLRVTSVGDLTVLFDTLGYDYRLVGEAAVSVPRLYLTALPGDIADGGHAGERPGLFINALLPVMLRVNEAIAADRAVVVGLAARVAAGAALEPAEMAGLSRLAEDYRVDPDQPAGAVLEALTLRVDAVPPSMALAQAALESGWGTSSLARNANALFGQTGSSGVRASTGHTYATFADLNESAEAYVRNLNTHPAYDDFRRLRAAQRAAGEALDGVALMDGLTAYSELGTEYIRYVRRLIASFDLHLLDGARLADPDDPGDRTPAAI